MTDPEQPKHQPFNDIADEFQKMGQNIADLLRGAWESEPRKKIQLDIEAGLNDVGAALKKAGEEFSQTTTGQTLKSDVEDLRQRIESGEFESKMRTEVLNALRAVNEMLSKNKPYPPESGPGGEQA